MGNRVWVSIGEAARLIGVSEPTLRKWTDSGRIAVFRTPGGHRRYLRSEIEAFRRSRDQSLIEEAEAGAPLTHGSRDGFRR
ncbi:MAG TPA: helix-turn-helix domain-containing protein [Dehalococcoidia bacterium]|nr:helix-turn-helix domain-containing protein [Dehalococcoidia bacterium]